MTGDRHPLEAPWPPFLDRLDSDPDRAWLEFHEFAWRLLRSRPPRVFRSLEPEVQEDLIAEIVLGCAEHGFRRLRTYRNRGVPFAVWLGTIARNRALDWVRRQRPKPDLPDLPSPAPDLLELTSQRDMLDLIRRCLGEIREKCRLLLEAAADGMKPREIASLLGLPREAGKQVSDDLRSCRRSLRRLMARYTDERPFTAAEEPGP